MWNRLMMCLKQLYSVYDCKFNWLKDKLKQWNSQSIQLLMLFKVSVCDFDRYICSVDLFIRCKCGITIEILRLRRPYYNYFCKNIELNISSVTPKKGDLRNPNPCVCRLGLYWNVWRRLKLFGKGYTLYKVGLVYSISLCIEM